MKFSRNCIFGSNWFMKTIFGALDTWARSVFKIHIFMAEKFLPATTWWAKMWLFLTFFSIYDQNVSKYGVIMSRTQIKSLWTVCLAKFDRRKVSLFFSYLQNIGLISRNEDILYRLFWVFSRTYDYISKSCIEYLYYPKYFSMRKIFLVCLAYLESRNFYHQHLLIFWHIWNLESAPIK